MKLVIISVISFFLLSGISVAGDSSGHREKYNYQRRPPKYNYQRYWKRNGHCNRSRTHSVPGRYIGVPGPDGRMIIKDVVTGKIVN